MNDNDNVLKFTGAKKPTPAEQKAANNAETTRIISEADAKAKQAQLNALDAVRKLVENDIINSFALIGRAKNGAILTELCPPGSMNYDYPAVFLGALHGLEAELIDMVQRMPQLLNDGTVVAHSDTTVL